MEGAPPETPAVDRHTIPWFSFPTCALFYIKREIGGKSFTFFVWFFDEDGREEELYRYKSWLPDETLVPRGLTVLCT